MQQVTKITKQEAKIAAKLYIASLFLNQDEFSTDGLVGCDESPSTNEVNLAIQNEINIIISRIRKGLEDSYTATSYDCILEAKKIVKEKKGKEK